MAKKEDAKSPKTASAAAEGTQDAAQTAKPQKSATKKATTATKAKPKTAAAKTEATKEKTAKTTAKAKPKTETTKAEAAKEAPAEKSAPAKETKTTAKTKKTASAAKAKPKTEVTKAKAAEEAPAKKSATPKETKTTAKTKKTADATKTAKKPPTAAKPKTTVTKEKPPAKKEPAKHYHYATGRRKNSVAKVRIYEEPGKVTVNGKTPKDYFAVDQWVMDALRPLETTGLTKKLTIVVQTLGGGAHGQAGAMSHGLARALIIMNNELRPDLKKAGLLTRDSRMRESKKYGLKRARKAPQYSKR